MPSVDLKKTLRELYTADPTPSLIEVPERWYLMIDGEGDPNTSIAYNSAVAALYPLAYGLRKLVIDTTGVSSTVMPLEGLWWVDDLEMFDLGDKSNWKWTAMISQPDDVDPDAAQAVIEIVTEKKRLLSGHLARL